MTLLRMIHWAVFSAAAIAALAVPAAADTSGPSFDCAKAKSRIEISICADAGMKAKDWWLDAIYRDAMTLAPARRDAIKQAQRRWVAFRDEACGDGDFHCLFPLYEDRMNALVEESVEPVWRQSAADPEQALAALKPLGSPLAKMYADILTHALSDESTAAFRDFADATAEVFGGESWERGAPDISLPCALVEKYPRLLLISRPYFGSTKDLGLPRNNCDRRSVPAPVTAFLKSNPLTLANWLDHCWTEGTMYRAYGAYLALRTDRMAYFPRSYLTDRLTMLQAPDQPWPNSQAIEESDWSSNPEYRSAMGILAAYYRYHDHLTEEDSETAATRALWDNRNTTGDKPVGCIGEE